MIRKCGKGMLGFGYQWYANESAALRKKAKQPFRRRVWQPRHQT